MNPVSRIFLSSLLALAPGVLSAGTISFFDGTFNDATWTTTAQRLDSPMAASASQVPAGGNPGQMRETVLSIGFTSPGQSAQAILMHLHGTFVYNPAIHGAITQIAFSYDTKATTPLNGTGMAYLPLLEQNGFFYAPAPALQVPPLFALSPASWTSYSFTGALNDWDLTPGSGLPDFSATGAPIRFGYFNTVITTCSSGPLVIGCAATSLVDALDNFSVTVTHASTAVPEPSSFLLGASALAALALLRRRRP